MTEQLLNADQIDRAGTAIDAVFTGSPQFRSESLSRIAGCDLICKVETMNPIGSFKGRGVDWWMQCNPQHQSVCCTSAGNFGQAMAYAARRHGRQVHVFTIKTANPAKVAAMRDLGATVHDNAPDYDVALKNAEAFAEEHGYHLIRDGREPAISEGAGTIAAELARLPNYPDVIYVPVGDGALINGIGSWCRARRPQTRIIGICAEGAPAMARSWESGSLQRTDHARTIADGIAIAAPIAEAAALITKTVDEMRLVSDSDILAAMQELHGEARLLTEAAGAVAWAAVRADAADLAGKTVAIILTGANIDPKLMPVWTQD